jgi:hypothetical protein
VERSRAEAVSDTFELVAVAGAGELVLYLDRFATNAPVDGARVDLETPDGSATAAPDGPGLYRLKAPWTARAGRHPLVVTVTADGPAEVLRLTLDSPQPATGAARARGLLSPAWLASTAGALAAVLFGAIAVRRWRRRSA